MQKKQYFELDFFNAIACLFVILIHVLSIGVADLLPSSWQMGVVYFPWKFAAYVVPGFLFTGAVKMALGFLPDKKTNYFSYIWRRIKKIYVPYVLWSLVYYLAFLKLGWVELDLGIILKYLWFGNISFAFYYVVLVMQFYLLMPLWKWLVKKVPFFMAIPSAAVLTLFMYHIGSFLTQFGLKFEWGDRIFPTYLFFWVLGLYVGKYYETIRDVVKKHKKSVYASLVWVVLYIVLAFYQQAKNSHVIDINVLKMFTDTLTIFAILTLCIALNDKDGLVPLKRVLGFVFSASFGVYLSHCLFLETAQALMRYAGINSITVLLIGRALVCYTLPFLLWYILNTIKNKFKRSRK